MKIEEDLTVKVISIDIEHLSAETQKTIEGLESYTDNVINEHLFGCDVIDDIKQNEPLNTNILSELEQLKYLCHENNASYFRIISL